MGTQGDLDTLILSLQQAHIDTQLATADQHLSDSRLSEIFVALRDDVTLLVRKSDDDEMAEILLNRLFMRLVTAVRTPYLQDLAMVKDIDQVRISGLRSTNCAYQSEILRLKDTNCSYQSEISRLKDTNCSYQTEIPRLIDIGHGQLMQPSDDKEAEIANLRQENEQLLANNKDLLTQKHKLMLYRVQQAEEQDAPGTASLWLCVLFALAKYHASNFNAYRFMAMGYGSSSVRIKTLLEDGGGGKGG